MKKLVVLLLSLVAFVSCNQTPVVTTSPFAGTWAGAFSVTLPDGTKFDPAGELTIIVSGAGTITGTIANPQNGPGKIQGGTISSQGAFTSTYTYDSAPTAVLGLNGTVAITGSTLIGMNLNNTDGTANIGTVGFSLTKK